MYRYRDSSSYAYLETCPVDQLKVVGSLQSHPDFLPKLIGGSR